jgi:hypothetical protein
VSGSAADLNIRLGRIQHRERAPEDPLRPVMLRARQGQLRRRGFGRTTVDNRLRLG